MTITLDEVRNVGQSQRKLKLKKAYLTEHQKKLMQYKKCFVGQLFDEPGRIYKWGTQLSPDKHKVRRDQWMPRFVPQIAEDLVSTHSAYLTGEDKFPCINATSAAPGLYTGLEVPEGWEGKEEKGQQKAGADALQAWATHVLTESDFQGSVSQAIDKALYMEETPVLLRKHGNKIWQTTADPTWCQWGYSDQDQDVITWFKESYFFTRDNDVDKDGTPNEYMFYRLINETDWIEMEFPIVVDPLTQEETLGEPKVIYDKPHGLDFCPVGIASVGRPSLFAGKMIDNIKGHIEWYNDNKTGIRHNAAPQWAILKERGDSGLQANRPGSSKDKPLTKGALWELEGRSLQSFTNQVDAYVQEGEAIEQEETSIRRSAKTIDIPVDNEQSGRALTIRMAPQFTRIDQYRAVLGKFIKDLAYKVLAMAHKLGLELPDGIKAPATIAQLKISLDWGNVLPVTPEQIQLEHQNCSGMIADGLMSKKSAQSYLLPLFGIEDIEQERIQIALEKEEAAQSDIALANAAFQQMKGDGNGTYSRKQTE